jgi:hypothetical protein
LNEKEQLIGKDVEGSGCGLGSGTIPALEESAEGD